MSDSNDVNAVSVCNIVEKVGFRFVRMKQVSEITGLSLGSIAYLQKKKMFPPSYKIGGRATGVKSNDLENWMKSRECVELTPLPADRR